MDETTRLLDWFGSVMSLMGGKACGARAVMNECTGELTVIDAGMDEETCHPPEPTACTCGHSVEEHGGNPNYPGATECVECDCIAFEADMEDFAVVLRLVVTDGVYHAKLGKYHAHDETMLLALRGLESKVREACRL